MKAIVYRRFGGPDQLRWEDVPDPEPPPDGVVVQMLASSLNVIDVRSLKGQMAPFVNNRFPKIPGIDVAGIVAKVGRRCRRLKIGDRVFGATNAFKGGAFAELVAVAESGLAPMPAALSTEEAAALPTTGLAALYALRELGRLQHGQSVLIHGSSGAAGLYATQIARLLGGRITTVSGTRGVEVSKALGADRAIDYTAGPPEFAERFDVVVDFSGAFPFDQARAQMHTAGRFVEASPTIPKFLGSLLANPLRRQKHLMLQTVARTSNLEYLASLVEQRQLTIHIAKRISLVDAADAFTEYARGGVVGKLAIVSNTG